MALEQERTQTQTQERTDTKVHIYQDHYEKERIYVRHVGSMRYTLTEERRERCAVVDAEQGPSGFGERHPTPGLGGASLAAGVHRSERGQVHANA